MTEILPLSSVKLNGDTTYTSNGKIQEQSPAIKSLRKIEKMKWLGNFVFVDISITPKRIARREPSTPLRTFPTPPSLRILSEPLKRREKPPSGRRQVFLTAHIEEEMGATLRPIRTHGRLR